MEYWINDIYYRDVEIKGVTVFQKCSELKLDLPCFCYHENLSIAGNCRMCLVEVNTSVKLVVACSMPLLNGMKVYTSNFRVKKARQSVLELLLNNHPLDCPICDQGGERDLQDLTLVFGSDKSRFYEYSKRAVFDKECGPFIKTIMTRCIHCTRCIRFLNDISNVNELGILNRGSNSEISTFIKQNLLDELSSNIIDLCPVGALTSKPYAFNARPWELNSIESIDIMDSIGSNIRIDYFNNQIYRILPIYNKYSNEDWITNKARFSYDSSLYQRIRYPMIKLNDKYVIVTYNKIFKIFFYLFLKLCIKNKYDFIPMFNQFIDLESLNSFNMFFNKLGSNIYINNNFNNLSFDFRNLYYFDMDIFFIENNIINVILIGCNMRLELPLFNSKFRKYNLLYGNIINVYSFGNYLSFDKYFYGNFGNKFFDIFQFFKGKLNLNKFLYFKKNLFNLLFFKSILFIKNYFFFGTQFFFSKFNFFFNKLYEYIYFIQGFIYISFSYLGYLNCVELGLNLQCFNKINANKRFFFFFCVDDVNLNFKKSDFIVYKGSFFDSIAKTANLIFPNYMHFENDSIYVNIEGKIKKNNKAIILNNSNIFSTKEFFFSLLIFKNYLKLNIFKFDKFFYLKLFFKFFNFNLELFKLNDFKEVYLLKSKYTNFFNFNYLLNINNIIGSYFFNYYKTDSISKNSLILHNAALLYLTKIKNFY